jgi:hypothetical protein
MVHSDFFYCATLDTTKPLLETKDGNKYVLIIIDHYFKWCESRMVDVDLILLEPLHTYYNNNFYTTNDVLPSSLIDSNVSLKWKQQKS